MASNKYTQGTPIAGQMTRLVLAERAYIKTYPDTSSVYYNGSGEAKLSGSDPAGFTDLGIVAGSKVTLAYTKETRYVETGIERIRRGAYITQKTAQATFSLEQFDVTVLEAISAQTGTAKTGGKMLKFGSDDVIEKALVFVGTNKVDGHEVHTYCSWAALTFQFQEADDARVIAVTADLFADANGNFMHMYIFD